MLRSLLNRKKTTDTPEPEPTKTGGKGRPTPTRREAEAAAKQRAKAITDAKGQAREQRMTNSARVREAMRTGDDRYLPARDKGPVKRFIRDSIDSRFSLLEFIMVLLVVTLGLSYSGNSKTQSYALTLQAVILLLLAVEGTWLIIQTRRAVAAAFPHEPLRGVSTYALFRAVYPRFLRMPKTQVSRGGKPITR